MRLTFSFLPSFPRRFIWRLIHMVSRKYCRTRDLVLKMPKQKQSTETVIEILSQVQCITSDLPRKPLDCVCVERGSYEGCRATWQDDWQSVSQKARGESDLHCCLEGTSKAHYYLHKRKPLTVASLDYLGLIHFVYLVTKKKLHLVTFRNLLLDVTNIFSPWSWKKAYLVMVWLKFLENLCHFQSFWLKILGSNYEQDILEAQGTVLKLYMQWSSWNYQNTKRR